MDKQTTKWLIIAAIIIGLIIVAVLIAKAAKPGTKTITGGGGTQTPGLGSLLGDVLQSDWWGNIFGGKKCDPKNQGFQMNGVFNPDKCGRPKEFECNPDKPGWNMQGFLDPGC